MEGKRKRRRLTVWSILLGCRGLRLTLLVNDITVIFIFFHKPLNPVQESGIIIKDITYNRQSGKPMQNS